MTGADMALLLLLSRARRGKRSHTVNTPVHVHWRYHARKALQTQGRMHVQRIEGHFSQGGKIWTSPTTACPPASSTRERGARAAAAVRAETALSCPSCWTAQRLRCATPGTRRVRLSSTHGRKSPHSSKPPRTASSTISPPDPTTPPVPRV